MTGEKGPSPVAKFSVIFSTINKINVELSNIGIQIKYSGRELVKITMINCIRIEGGRKWSL